MASARLCSPSGRELVFRASTAHRTTNHAVPPRGGKSVTRLLVPPEGMRAIADTGDPARRQYPRSPQSGSLALGIRAMSKNSSANISADPLALRLAALAALMDHVMLSLRQRSERICEARVAVALAREADGPSEPQSKTGIRRRDLNR